MSSPVNKSKVLIRRPPLALSVFNRVVKSRNLVCECWVPILSLKLKSTPLISSGLKSKHLLLKNYYHLTLIFSNKVNFMNICKLVPWYMYSTLKTSLTFKLNVINLLVQFSKNFDYFSSFRPALSTPAPVFKEFPASPNLL